jgi:hypothetical protein
MLPASGNRTAPSSPSARDRTRRSMLHARLRAGQNCPPSIAAPPGAKADWQARGAAESPVTEASIVIEAKSSGQARHWRLPRRGPRREARAAPVSQTCRHFRFTLATDRSAHRCDIQQHPAPWTRSRAMHERTINESWMTELVLLRSALSVAAGAAGQEVTGARAPCATPCATRTEVHSAGRRCFPCCARPRLRPHARASLPLSHTTNTD